MKREEFTPCVVCSRPLGEANGVLFYRLEIQRMAFDHRALRELAGVELITGSARIAETLAPTREIAKTFGEKGVVLVCDDCACRRSLPIAAMEEIASRMKEDQREAESAHDPNDPGPTPEAA